jgi:Dyp-type peroxidase family
MEATTNTIVTPINFKEPANEEFLGNLQANILKHHGRENAWHVFLRFAADKKAVKGWISGYAAEITDAGRQLLDTFLFNETKGLHDAGPVICFFLSANGYNALDITSGLPGDPGKKDAFWLGLKDHGYATLNDPPVTAWQAEFQSAIDAMILLADDDIKRLENELKKITKKAGALFTIVHVQKGEILRNKKRGIEHFGYADGVSQPVFLEDELPPGKVWDDNEDPFKIALVKEEVAGHDDCYGSFLVFRKPEQNVKAFKEQEEEIGEKLLPRLPKEEEEKAEVAGAYIVGRFEDGTPVVKHDEALAIEEEQPLDNDFHYGTDTTGSRCPYHAHIRMTNPRDRTLSDFTRIVRRGIPYDEAGRNGDLEWFPEGNVGLLFMCYQASIDSQFAVIQGKWANRGDIFPEKTGIDGIIGQQREEKNTNTQWLPLNWGSADRVKMATSFAGFVTLKGGEYFYAPSIPFLKNINK